MGNHDDKRIDDVVPLVVNTMGWNKGLGADLTRQIEEILEPTHIINFREPVRQYNLQRDVKAAADDEEDSAAKFFEVDPIPDNVLSLRYTASDWRTISLVSYFHAQFLNGRSLSLPSVADSLVTWFTSVSLVSALPYIVDPKEAFDTVILAGAGTEDVAEAEIGRVLNGAIVALVKCRPGTVDLPEEGTQKIKYVQGAPPPDPLTSSCIGLALIRAVSPSLISLGDSSKEPPVLQIVTPIPTELLFFARCVVKGEIELPLWCMLNHRELDTKRNKEQEKDIPYLRWSKAEGFGADRRRVRRNILRRGQM